MKVKTINFVGEGYVECKSCFYSAQDVLSDDTQFAFSTGINKMVGDIDSGIWAVSYLLSMYQHNSKDCILFSEPKVQVNDSFISLENLMLYSCYMDESYPLFRASASVKDLVTKGLSHYQSKLSPNEIKDIFHLDSNRFEHSLSETGSEIYKAMSAIAYCYKKTILCFPWMSQKRFKRYETHMYDLLNILNDMNSLVILPIGK